jgi:hypothetical protein
VIDCFFWPKKDCERQQSQKMRKKWLSFGHHMRKAAIIEMRKKCFIFFFLARDCGRQQSWCEYTIEEEALYTTKRETNCSCSGQWDQPGLGN